ncbi:MAG: DUF4397 domain-containing protein [Mucilaginibacter sp.]
MNKKKNTGFSVLLFLIISGCLLTPFISSCGKTSSANATTLNIQYQVVNLSPDLGPISLYLDFHRYNNSAYYYPSASGYFYLSSIDTPFQIRPTPNTTGVNNVQTSNIFNIDTLLKPAYKYTLFVTGFNADSSLTYKLLTDITTLPPTGQGKVRFINLSPQSTPFQVLVNGTSDPAFTNLQYTKVSSYINVPAGTYNFQVFPTGKTTGDVIGSESNVTIQDGRAYTIYSYGLVGHTDSLAFGMGVITNR